MAWPSSDAHMSMIKKPFSSYALIWCKADSGLAMYLMELTWKTGLSRMKKEGPYSCVQAVRSVLDALPCQSSCESGGRWCWAWDPSRSPHRCFSPSACQSQSSSGPSWWVARWTPRSFQTWLEEIEAMSSWVQNYSFSSYSWHCVQTFSHAIHEIILFLVVTSLDIPV